MTQDERRKEIMYLLQDSVSLETNRLAVMFGVSPVTIRRDFDFLEKQGFVTSTYGGAIVNRTLPEVVGEDVSIKRSQEKRQMAKAAAALIQPGDTILLDAGSTVKELAIELLAKTDVTVFTNSILVMNVLAQSSSISLISLPGQFRKSSMCVFGAMTLDFLDCVHVDYAFIGVTGLSLEAGGTIPDPDEAFVKRKMSKVAKRTVVMVDHLKLGVSSVYSAFPITDVDLVITGQSGSEEAARIREAGIQVIEAAPREKAGQPGV